MKTRNKVMMLTLATVGFSIGGLMALPKTTANANTDTPAFYMETGASVNIDDETYGGIRWTTVIEEGYEPVSGADASNVKFGTFVVPTKTYENAIATTEIKDMTDVVNITSEATGEDALLGEIVYHSAIKYDDIIEDYKRANNIDELSATEETEILTEAYQMELTAVSYALYEGEYYYATAVETSRSARQVANIAILSNLLGNASSEKTNQINSYVETGADDFARTKLDNASEGYLDLTELSASEVVEQAIDVSGLSVDFTNDVAEVLVGANRLTTNDYTYADGMLSLKKASAGLEAGKETWLSVFTTNGNVYSLPVIPADGVIRSVQDLNDTFGMNNPQVYGNCQVCGGSIKNSECTCDNGPTDWYEPSLFGYYVLGNDLNATTEGVNHVNDGKNGGTTGMSNIIDITGGFRGTFDGRGYSITDLTLKNYGLFGWTVDATIKNVAFLKTTLVKQSSGMVLANRMYNTRVENVYIELDNSYKSAGTIFGIARSCMFKNCIFDVDFGNYDRSSLSNDTKTWNSSTYTGEYNTFENTYVISTDLLYTSDTVAYDAHNWAVTDGNATVNVKDGEIKRYLDTTDMFDNVYYSYDDNGTVVKSTDTSENDWTAFDSTYWNIDTTNKSISWK